MPRLHQPFLKLRPCELVLTCAVVYGTVAACSQPPRALEVEFAGCKELDQGPVCHLDGDRELTLWTRAEGPLQVDPQGVELVSEEAVGGGRRLRLEIAPGVEELRLRAQSGAVWRLALRVFEEPAWRRQIRGLPHTEARQVLLDLLPEVADSERGVARGQLARLDRILGEPEEVWSSRLLEAIDEHRRYGRARRHCLDSTAMSYWYLRSENFAAARQLLSQLPPDEGSGLVAWQRDYNRGLLAFHSGDLRSALSYLEKSARLAERLGMGQLEMYSTQVLVRLFVLLGRSSEGWAQVETLRRQLPEDLTGCRRSQWLNNTAWMLLLVREAGEAADDPTPILQEALQWAEENPCEGHDEALNILTNLALAHLQNGRLAACRDVLETVQARNPAPQEDMWLLDIAGRLELAEGRPGASLDYYRRLGDVAEPMGQLGALWRAAVGRARALRDQGNSQAALGAFREAAGLLLQETRQVPIHQGIEGFVAGREQAVREWLELLLDTGRVEEALAVARRSRAQVLWAFRRLASPSADLLSAKTSLRRQRDEEDREVTKEWELPADRLERDRHQRQETKADLLRQVDEAVAKHPVPPSQEAGGLPRVAMGEVRLLFHPGEQGWIGFAEDSAGVMARRLGELSPELAPEELGRRLLQPFAERIEGARRIRILPYGFLRRVDFHALSVGGDRMLEKHSVAYGLDLAPAETAPGRFALIVADPQGDLPAARAEARLISRILAGDGRWDVRSIEGSEALGETVRERLTESDLFHFAGHGTQVEGVGWESALLLRDGSRLTLADILMLERAPQWVVLSGCETGRSADLALESVTSLAHAFLISGSRAVVAAIRPVDDRTTRDLMDAFYSFWSDSGFMVPEEALRRAQEELRRGSPGVDWASFRILVR